MTHKEVMQQALEAHKMLRDWIKAVPQEVALPAMPGIDGDWLDEVESNLRAALEQPQQEQSVRNTDELPSGFVSLQQENGRVVYAACMDRDARHYKWLMWKHPDGRWVSKRKLENWEVMQVEDQEHYGIVQEAAHGIKEET